MIFEQYDEKAGIKLIFETPKKESYFFGYYDQSPLSKDSKYLLSHHVKFDGRNVEEGDVCEIGYFTLDDKKFHIVDTVTTFNFQQGARLQWLPNYPHKIIYNLCIDGKFKSCIYDLETGVYKYYECAIYSVHPSGKYALCIDFAHLRYCRYGYGYCGGNYPNASQPLPQNHGVYKLDLETGTISCFMETRYLLRFCKKQMPVDCRYWIEHMTWNHTGSSVALYFRYGDAKTIGLTTQLFTCDENGENLFEYTENMDYSHLGWKDDETFVVYSRPYSKVRDLYSQATKNKNKTFFQKGILLLRPLYRLWKMHLSTSVQQQRISNGNMGYYVLKKGELYAQPLLCGVLNTDGHPSYHMKYGNIILTDSYADKEGFRHLLLINTDKQKYLELGKFYSNDYENDFRCDLHPRWDYTGTKIIIDTPHENNGRQILVFDAKNAIKKALEL